ncbi:MAG: nitroreductase family protein [Eubacteriales bacterium]|nr:nitroreductase family protein [Eubacteriales bacterium]
MILDSLKNRRTIYSLGKDINVDEQQILDTIKEVTKYVPHAFDAKSNVVYVLTGAKHDELWDRIYDAFEGKVAREKIDGFKAAYGTVLYFINKDVVKHLEESIPLYAQNFYPWANQAIGMLQLSVWSALSDLGLGASLQHYNPIINKTVAEMLDLPQNLELNAQMPFGQILAGAGEKDFGNIEERFHVVK